MFLAGKRVFKVFDIEEVQQEPKFSMKSRYLPWIYRRSSISPTPSFPGQDLRHLQLSNSPKEMPRTEYSLRTKTHIEPASQPRALLPGGCPLGQGADDPAQTCVSSAPTQLTEQGSLLAGLASISVRSTFYQCQTTDEHGPKTSSPAFLGGRRWSCADAANLHKCQEKQEHFLLPQPAPSSLLTSRQGSALLPCVLAPAMLQPISMLMGPICHLQRACYELLPFRTSWHPVRAAFCE